MLKVYINPWDEKFGTFGTDARVTSQEFLKKVLEREKIPSRIFIGNFSYQTLRFRYHIGEDMGLHVKKTVLFRFEPWVLRYSSILEGIMSIHSMREGIFLLKIALQKDYLDSAARGGGADILQIPYRLEGEDPLFLRQEYGEEARDFEDLPAITISAPNGKPHSLSYGDQFIGSSQSGSGQGHQIPYRYNTQSSQGYSGLDYGDPRRKRAISMVKNLFESIINI